MNLVKRLFEILETEGIVGGYYAVKRAVYWNLIPPIADYLNIKKEKEVIVDILGPKMILDLSDKGISRDLYFNKVREPESTRLLIKELEDVKNGILDIGANIGYYVLIEAKSKKAGKVLAVEPDPWNFKLLKRQIEINDLYDEVELYDVAIGDKVGKIKFACGARGNNSRVAYTSEEGIEVEITTVDKLIQNRQISLLRFDTEGYEYFIIKGAKETLENNDRLKIFMEVHPHYIKKYGGNIEEMWKILADNDFKIKYFVNYRNPPLRFTRRGLFHGEVIKMNVYLSDAIKDPKLKKILNTTFGYHLFLEKWGE